MTERCICLQALPTGSPTAQRYHVGLDLGLVDKDQARSIDPALMRLPAGPFTGDVGTVLLGGMNCFF